MAGIALLMAVWWVTEALPLGATGLLPLALFPLLGILPAGRTAEQFGHDLIFLFFSGFVLARALARWRLDRRLALAVVSLAGSDPRRIVLAIMSVTAFLSMWVSNSATAAVMMPVALALISHAADEIRRRDLPIETASGRFRFGTAVMLAVAYGASIGGVGTLIGTPPNVLVAGMLEGMTGERIGFVRWMAIGMPVVAILLPAIWAWLVFVAYRPGFARLPAGREVVRAQLRELGPMGRGAWLAAAVMTLTAAAWITRGLWEGALVRLGVLPEGLLTDTTIGMAGALALFILPSRERPGERLLDGSVWSEIPWGVLLLFGGGLALAEGFQSTGLARLLGSAVVGWSGVPFGLFLALACLVVIVLTEFASNTATAAMILPLLGAAAPPLGLEPAALMIPAALCSSLGFMMPAGTPPNAIVFGTGYVTMPQMVRAGFAANLISLAVVTALGLLLVPRLW
jgi:sodium-dependent dicarboxylate transporter 2/3/5